jgi:hypothetical protein
MLLHLHNKYIPDLGKAIFSMWKLNLAFGKLLTVAVDEMKKHSHIDKK